MSNSKLVDYTKLSPNCNKPRNHVIDKITIHHMAGNLSVETCGNVFLNREASANYGIGSDGRVGLYVEECNRAWTSSNAANDNRAVTIEVANDGGADTDWHVSDVALAKLIDLCVDICERNGITKLNYTGDANGNLTRHNMFIATTCPGPYLQSKFPYIASEVNKRLAGSPEPTPTEDDIKVGDKVLVLNGVATADSYGGGASTSLYTGDINDPDNIRYVTLITDLSRPRPYHISKGSVQGDGDRGWVSKSQIRKI